MSKVKAATAMPSLHRRGYWAVGLLLLVIFIGRIALVSVYGYAGVQKPNTSLCANGSEQEDNDKKEESKYAEKQFKCFSPLTLSNLVPVYFITGNLTQAMYTPNYVAVNCLTVLTPPPNC